MIRKAVIILLTLGAVSGKSHRDERTRAPGASPGTLRPCDTNNPGGMTPVWRMIVNVSPLRGLTQC